MGWQGSGALGEREVRVATQLVQAPELVVDTAPAAVGTPVGERPVAVDEAPRGTAVLTCDEPVASQIEQRGPQLVAQRFARVAVVMEVNLDFPEPRLRELAERLDEGAVVLLPREEERVTRRASVAVAEARREHGETLSPCAYALETDFARRPAVQGLEVVAHREQQMPLAAHAGQEHLAHAIAEPGARPDVDLLAQNAAHRRRQRHEPHRTTPTAFLVPSCLMAARRSLPLEARLRAATTTPSTASSTTFASPDPRMLGASTTTQS